MFRGILKHLKRGVHDVPTCTFVFWEGNSMGEVPKIK